MVVAVRLGVGMGLHIMTRFGFIVGSSFGQPNLPHRNYEKFTYCLIKYMPQKTLLSESVFPLKIRNSGKVAGSKSSAQGICIKCLFIF